MQHRRATLSTSSMAKNVPVLSFFFQFRTITLEQFRPGELWWHRRKPVERRFRLLVRHFQEQQKRRLLDETCFISMARIVRTKIFNGRCVVSPAELLLTELYWRNSSFPNALPWCLLNRSIL